MDKVEIAIVEMMRRGDENDAIKLLEREWGRALRVQAQVLAGESDADDVLQETVLAVLPKLRDAGAPLTAVRAYVFQALRRQAFDHRRSFESKISQHAVDPEAADLLPPPSSKRPSNAPDAEEVAARLVARLEPRQREVIQYRNQGLSHREIGARLGIAEENARAIAARTTKLLRTWWEKEYEAPLKRAGR